MAIPLNAFPRKRESMDPRLHGDASFFETQRIQSHAKFFFFVIAAFATMTDY